MMISPMVTSMRRNICALKKRKLHSAHVSNSTTPGKQARTELDTRADTSCSGINFWLHQLTGKPCSVALFSTSYKPMTDIQVATCLTAYTDEYGRTWVLVFHEVIWFGSSMEHSLVNPNQIRMTGTPVLEIRLMLRDRLTFNVTMCSLTSKRMARLSIFKLMSRLMSNGPSVPGYS